MAKTTNQSPNFREIMTSIKKGNFAPVYILMGEEPYYIDQIAKAIENHAIEEDDKDFNCDIFYGADAEIASVVGSAAQFPVMASRKLVFLKEAQSMQKAKTQLDKLAPYVARPTSTTILVVTYKGEALGASSALIKSANASGAIVFKSPRLKDWQLATPVKDYCTQHKIKIDDKSVALLCEYIGQPLSKLFGEIDKLIVACGSGSTITPDAIEQNIGISKDFNAFELKSAIAARDYAKAMTIVDYFSRNPKNNPTVMTVGQMFDFASKLVIAHAARDRSDSTLMADLDVKTPYALKDIKTALANYSFAQAVQILHAVRELDAKIKGIGSMQNEYELLKEFVFKAMTVS